MCSATIVIGQIEKKFAEYADILYSQALLIEGIPIENPVEFTNKLCEIMAE